MADSVVSTNIGSGCTLASATRDQSGDGEAIVAAPGVGRHIVIKEFFVWLTDPATSVNLTPKLGSLTLPVVGLSSGRTGWGFYREDGIEIHLAPNTALYANLSSGVSVGVMCSYDLQ